MRDVEFIKQTRDKLFEDYMLIEEKRRLLLVNNSFNDMTGYDKKVYCYMTSTMEKLMLQIDTFSFLLNEDVELIDVSLNTYYNLKHSIDKEVLTV